LFSTNQVDQPANVQIGAVQVIEGVDEGVAEGRKTPHDRSSGSEQTIPISNVVVAGFDPVLRSGIAGNNEKMKNNVR